MIQISCTDERLPLKGADSLNNYAFGSSRWCSVVVCLCATLLRHTCGCGWSKRVCWRTGRKCTTVTMRADDQQTFILMESV